MKKPTNFDIELILIRNVLNSLVGQSVELAMAVLIRVLQALMIGAAKDRETALGFLDDLEKHLHEQISNENIEEFGYMLKDGDTDPILHDDHVRRMH